MKALTLKQPWVYAIFHEGKDIENRTWKRDFTGWLAIHAAKSPRRDIERFPSRIDPPDLKTLDYSAICGVAYVAEIVTRSRSKWFYRPNDGSINYGWRLSRVISLRYPIRCTGALGLWELSPKIVRQIRQQLPYLKID